MRKFFLAAALAVVALCSSSPSADAGFVTRISSDGGATFASVIADNGAGDTNPAVGGITTSFALPGGGTVQFTLNSNRTQALPFGRLSQVELAFAGTTFNSGAAVFVIEVTDTNYTAPAGPIARLTSETSGTGFNGQNPSTGNISFQSWATGGNTEFSTSGITGGVQGPFVNTNFGGPTAPDTVVTQGPLAAPYTITSRFTISNVNIPAGGSLQLTGTATVTAVTATPAPAGLVLALAGMPFFGLGAYIRRRRAAKSE